MPKLSVLLNHLAYTNYTIIFLVTHEQSLRKLMKILGKCETQLGKLINKCNSAWYMYQNSNTKLESLVDICTCISRGHFPFTYLRCPISHAKQRKYDYNDLIKKVKEMLQTWKGKILFFGGKATLINSVLQSIPIHILSATVSPSMCNQRISQKIF